ncbi:cytochrome c oxidase assembly protein subunit 15 [Methylacidimicrobium cyclopophantes]|uniref:Cytochrome c oxidase assembly protein subunit 15 n=1 Tax=Methylacidimicrobium cyclopophantes TaxID=1041766 RepID=A0A5E6M991_9BACT|nr:COX15/CtaA family protein [Methylacidimicrobium cyclopophantes]VVM05777.1 cytochrome c oxidase assembly protein subunit 15 [Methylacidimicrobium cyclopophantes]
METQRLSPSKALHWFCGALVVATLILIGVGALVTSTESGMSVPDWPTSFGYNMFSLPLARWAGGVLYEHSHRLAASAVGFLTIILAGWLWFRERRPWLRWAGVVALLLVILQGIVGGLRVVWVADRLGILHAALAQSFLALVAVIWLATSARLWLGADGGATGKTESPNVPAWLASAFLGLSLLLFLQLLVAAAMRHAHAWLSIPDFPTAYGQLWPHIGEGDLASINAQRAAKNIPPTSLFQIHLQLVHRGLALLILLCAIALSAGVFPKTKRGSLRRTVLWFLALTAVQIGIGAFVIWSGKSVFPTTLHVLLGAGLFLLAVLGTGIAYRLRWLAGREALVGEKTPLGDAGKECPA